MKKILFIMVLIFSILTTTQSAFAYFDKDNTPVLQADDRLYVLNPKLTTSNKFLVPMDSILGVNDTYYYTYKYEIIVETGVELESSISNIVWNNSNLSFEDLKNVFNFEIQIDHIGETSISNGLFQNSTDAEIVEVTVTVSMNNLPILANNSTILGDTLDFSYLLTVSNKNVS